MVFPINFWVDGRRGDGQLDVEVARGFYQDGRMPKDFHRASKPMSAEGIEVILAAHEILPGSDVNGTNTYTFDPSSPSFSTDDCTFYNYFVNNTVVSLYPSPTGVLKDALNRNLDLFHLAAGADCPKVFPYGQD
ncbi:hypothetical protein NP233_g3099 [Leucocoprinus birnbaumii]|uniref:Uncharacterized protein n=1 Tax=Leucocoprinus birnbaumii TaxID=56174 RepID=A0AAD5YY75_9AGAR|nr:hypothetical protein NP233_g3099 [Leucocoprinus birnbaumii]